MLHSPSWICNHRAEQSVGGWVGKARASSRLLHTTLPNPTQQGHALCSTAVFSHTRSCCHISSSAFLHRAAHDSSPPSFPPHHCVFVCLSGITNCNMSHSILFFCPNGFTCKYCNETLVWFKVSKAPKIPDHQQRLISDILL